MSAPTPFPRHLAVLLLALLACSFAGNHIAARIAFDNEAGVLLAILCRSGVTLLVLSALVAWQRQPLRLPPGAWRWQLLMGLLIAIQSLCLYSAVARIPVALALLAANTFPIILALLNWALGGPPPTRRTAWLMGMILFGLLFALDVPARLSASEEVSAEWLLGIGLAFCGACAFASALWLTEHKLSTLRGSLRSMLTMLIVFSSALVAGTSDLLPGAVTLPAAQTGWIALGVLALLYGVGFTLLFVCMPRLDMMRNAPVMNVEPVATLLLGWVILGQVLSHTQMVGGVIVISGIVLLTYRKHP
ncbi:DMT family transporter [Pseudomonas sp. MMS21-TM103]|uniref:EamA family transporter n=1 Tax=Pseudomonas sp. MMS21 TM103 TaxID=2886506 RepID=UPI001EDD5AFD|nr:DMT family transporter [Pseudomonas sp. MMS21 TM103]MCG4451715.1 DMT family transporter [Pseudomonas sp. MMS21 TM103]